jgi:hypothetical protein
LFLVPNHENSQVSLAGMDIPYMLVTGMDQPIKDGRGGLNTIIRELLKTYRKDPDEFPYDTIVLESLSHYCDLVQEDLTQGGQLIMDQPKWGKLASHLRKVQVDLRSMEVHVVYTALDKTSDDDSGQTVGGPLIPGQSGQKVPSACDIICYAEMRKRGKDEWQYRVHFRNYKHFPARVRSRYEVPSVMDDLTFKKLSQYLKGPKGAKKVKAK